MLNWNKNRPELYAGKIKDASQAVELLIQRYQEKYGKEPDESIIRSWRGSLPHWISKLNAAGFGEHGILLELEIPGLRERIDCLLIGRSEDGRISASVVEFKGHPAGANTDVVQEAQRQVAGYQAYLQQFHSLWTTGDKEIATDAFVYFHNSSQNLISTNAYQKASPLMEHLYQLQDAPEIFTNDRQVELIEHLQKRIGAMSGDVEEILNGISVGFVHPSAEAMETFARMIEGHPGFLPCGDQRRVCDLILTEFEAARQRDKRTLFLVKGGPGTGKTVLGMSLLTAFQRIEKSQGKESVFCYATPGGGTIPTLRYLLCGSTDPRKMPVALKGILQYSGGLTSEQNLDFLLIDEAHRLSKQDLSSSILSAQFPILLIDELQGISPGGIRSIDEIIQVAKREGYMVSTTTLTQQLRYRGGEEFVEWVNNVLQIQSKKPAIWERHDIFPIHIFDSPQEMVAILNALQERGEKCRTIAGFCWKTKEGVNIDDFHMPWYEMDSQKGGAEKQIWSVHKEGHKFVGAPYFTQNFEFDYIGVIIGPDLKYNGNSIISDHPKNHDPALFRSRCSDAEFSVIAKNIYRMLLTRGRKGCFIYCVDDALKKYLQSFLAEKMQKPRPPMIVHLSKDIESHKESVLS